MASLRTYCKHDPVVVQKLVGMLTYLEGQEHVENEYKITIKEELSILIHHAKSAFETKKDKALIQNVLKA